MFVILNKHTILFLSNLSKFYYNPSKELMVQSKEIKQNLTGTKIFDIYFYAVFDYYGQTFNSLGETGYHPVLSFYLYFLVS